MADTLVERVAGQTTATQVPIEIQLVMTDRALLGDDPTSAVVAGYGPVPAPFARRLVRDLDPDTRAWLRRLVTDPVTGRLTGMDTHRRLFDGHHRRVGRGPRRDLPHPMVRGARSGTPTTSSPSRPAVRPANQTGKACAKPATTPSKPTVGAAGQALAVPANPSRSPPRPDTPTSPDRHPCPAHYQHFPVTHGPVVEGPLHGSGRADVRAAPYDGRALDSRRTSHAKRTPRSRRGRAHQSLDRQPG